MWSSVTVSADRYEFLALKDLCASFQFTFELMSLVAVAIALLLRFWLVTVIVSRLVFKRLLHRCCHLVLNAVCIKLFIFEMVVATEHFAVFSSDNRH